MTGLQLLHDPVNGDAPTVLLLRNNAIEVRFHAETDATCARCNRTLNVHVWQLIDPQPNDPDLRVQRGVIDCEVTG